MDKAAEAYMKEEIEALEQAAGKYIATGGKIEDLCLYIGGVWPNRWKELRAGDQVIVRLDKTPWENFNENP
jgi:hypothetical protein